MSSPRMKPADLEREIRALLEAPLENAELRERLERLAAEQPAFSGFTWLWGPILYRRNRIVFRPFILARFSTFLMVSRFKWKAVKWKGSTGQALDEWLAMVDREDDVELFRRLKSWKLTPPGSWRLDSKTWRTELLQRFNAADSAPGREIVLRKYDTWFEFDEATAMELYATDPKASAPFILRRLPWSWSGQKRKLWETLWQRVRERGDEDFARKLYKRQVPLDRWERDVLLLCNQAVSTDKLIERLEQHHPEGHSLDLGNTFIKLLEKRGRDVFPYVMKHLRQVWSGWLWMGSYNRVLALARERQWWDLWAALVRICSRPTEFNREIGELLEDSALPPTEVRKRLLAISGVSREWNFLRFGFAQVHQLSQKTALLMYERFPDLLRGSFKVHLQNSHWGTSWMKLLERLFASNDEALLDFLASRQLTLGGWYFRGGKKVPEVESLADYYETLRRESDAAFARRAANVLGQVPAFSIHQYNSLIRENRLARLLFERSALSYLDDPRAVSDLVEASEIHVMALGYRALGLDAPRARELAPAHLPLLLGTLLRPLHRATRALAFKALLNAATTEENARLILDRSRAALDLPDSHYPKEQLVGLIGQLLHRWPQLRSEKEQPVIYRRLAA